MSKTKNRSVGNVILNIIFYPFLLLMFAMIIMLAIGVRPYITMSGSMEPEIKTGSICFVDTKFDYDDVVVGDVIAYEQTNGGLVTHRVINITNNGFETQGDANDVSDGVSTSVYNFRGKTLFSVPGLGYLVKTLQKPPVFAMFIVLMLGFFAYMIVDAIENRVRGKYERTKESKKKKVKGKHLKTKKKPTQAETVAATHMARQQR